VGLACTLQGGRLTRDYGLPFGSEGDFGFVDELQSSEGTREGAGRHALRRLPRRFG